MLRNRHWGDKIKNKLKLTDYLLLGTYLKLTKGGNDIENDPRGEGCRFFGSKLTFKLKNKMCGEMDRRGRGTM